MDHTEHWFVASPLADVGMPAIMHYACHDYWLAKFSLINMHTNVVYNSIIYTFLNPHIYVIDNDDLSRWVDLSVPDTSCKTRHVGGYYIWCF